jgi:hypothetical protein
VGITIKDSTVGLVVTVDGKQVFSGTMLPGTAQTFRGSASVKITTNNAGATHVVITNNQVVGKNLGALGGQGEVKRNLEFAKDTNFP